MPLSVLKAHLKGAKGQSPGAQQGLDRFPVKVSRCAPHFSHIFMRFLLRLSSTCLRHACGFRSPGRMNLHENCEARQAHFNWKPV